MWRECDDDEVLDDIGTMGESSFEDASMPTSLPPPYCTCAALCCPVCPSVGMDQPRGQGPGAGAGAGAGPGAAVLAGGRAACVFDRRVRRASPLGCRWVLLRLLHLHLLLLLLLLIIRGDKDSSGSSLALLALLALPSPYRPTESLFSCTYCVHTVHSAASSSPVAGIYGDMATCQNFVCTRTPISLCLLFPHARPTSTAAPHGRG